MKASIRAALKYLWCVNGAAIKVERALIRTELPYLYTLQIYPPGIQKYPTQVLYA